LLNYDVKTLPPYFIIRPILRILKKIGSVVNMSVLYMNITKLTLV